ncbi:tetratricopeptide repeat protein [Aquimarina sp. SS2-1]|uniref:tetratricopeptide repeat protein n=1 Tax=Aquimarina besae TaxID=3342247 RepID=UPI00366FF270
MNQFLNVYQNVKIPQRLESFFETEDYKNYSTHFAWGLKGFSRDVKAKINFSSKGLEKIFEYFAEQGLSEKHPYFIPFAILKNMEPSCFVIDHRNSDCPVLFFDCEKDLFYDHSANLDEFLNSLLTSKEKTPIKRVEAATKKAQTLIKKKNYPEAIEQLSGALLNYPDRDDNSIFDSNTKTLPNGFKTLATCYLLNKNPEKAKEVLEKGVHRKLFSCGAYLVEVYSKGLGDYQKAIKVGEEALHNINNIDNYRAWCDLRENLGLVYVLEGMEEEANKMYKQLHGGNIENARKSLQTLIKENHSNKGLAEEILTWFTPKK